MKKIFISHSSKNEGIASELVKFLILIGVDEKEIFCSSIPNTAVKSKIRGEIKDNLEKSCFNIVILSKEYYESVYCLGESGIVWYKDDIENYVIALPEINPKEIDGFINGENIIRRLDNKNDLLFLHDEITKLFDINVGNTVTINKYCDDLISRYGEIVSKRSPMLVLKQNHIEKDTKKPLNIYGDDAKILMYFIIKSSMLEFSYQDVFACLNQEEICHYDIDNGIHLLKNVIDMNKESNRIIISESSLKDIMDNSEEISNMIQPCVNAHKSNARLRFVEMVNNHEISENMLLFIKYMRDTDDFDFGVSLFKNETVKKIKRWESRNRIKDMVSSNYDNNVNRLYGLRFIYKSKWSTKGNLAFFTLYDSITKVIISKRNKELEEQIAEAYENNKKKGFLFFR